MPRGDKLPKKRKNRKRNRICQHSQISQNTHLHLGVFPFSPADLPHNAHVLAGYLFLSEVTFIYSLDASFIYMV